MEPKSVLSRITLPYIFDRNTNSVSTGTNDFYASSSWILPFRDRVIRFKCCMQNTIYDVLKARGWQEVIGYVSMLLNILEKFMHLWFHFFSDNLDLDFFWCDREWLRENYHRAYIPENTKICHFPNHAEVEVHIEISQSFPSGGIQFSGLYLIIPLCIPPLCWPFRLEWLLWIYSFQFSFFYWFRSAVRTVESNLLHFYWKSNALHNCLAY